MAPFENECLLLYHANDMAGLYKKDDSLLAYE
jgi:hypothetical protein